MIRKSKKRDAIWQELCALSTHPNADMLHAQLKSCIPDLSLGTVYTNLCAFKREGMAVSVGTVNGKERFDGNVTPHAHFICRECGEVRDLWDVPIPAHPQVDDEIDSCRLSYFGRCAACCKQFLS